MRLAATPKQEPLGVTSMFDSNDDIIAVSDEDVICMGTPTLPLLNPQIEPMVEVDLRRNGSIVPTCGDLSSLFTSMIPAV